MDKAVAILLVLFVFGSIAVGADTLNQLNDGRVETVVKQLVK